MSRNPQLESRILDDPSNVDAYRVYADWLSAQGDPRGELIVLHLEMARQFVRRVNDRYEGIGPNPTADLTDARFQDVLDRERTLFDRHRARFLPGSEEAQSVLRLTWHLGFVRSAAVGTDAIRPRLDPNQLMRELLQSESTPFLVNLSVWRDVGPILDALVVEAKPARLKSLFVTGIDQQDTEQGLDAFYAAFPSLEQLELRGRSVSLGAIHLPKLRSLVMRLVLGVDEMFAAIPRAHMPELRRLSLAVPAFDLQAGKALPAPNHQKAIDRILDAYELTELNHLDLHYDQEVTSWLRPLVGSPLLAQLETLRIAGHIGEDTAHFLGQNADAFAHLKSCSVEALDARNLSEGALRALWFLRYDERLATRDEDD